MKIVINVVLAQCILCYFEKNFTINVGGIGAYFVYFHWYLRKDVTRVEFNTRTQTDIY